MNATAQKKNKGPFRIEAIIPVAIVFALFFAYFKFFFDQHLKLGIEYGATYANGAEVNVGSLKTSFLKASLQIKDIQVTNKELPKQNLVQVGNVSFKTDWDGLLRGKIVISDASINNIMVNTPRKKPGKVLPVKESSESTLETVKGMALAETQKALDGSLFGDLADIVQGTNYKDKLKEMENNLKSSQFIEKLETELKAKETQWKERLEKLPDNKDIKALEARIKGLKTDGKDPSALMNSIKEIDDIYKDINEQIRAVKESKTALGEDIKANSNVFSEIKTFVDEDIKDLEKKLGIPSLDAKDIGMQIFGRQFASEIQRVEKYMRLAREYMPPPKKPGESDAKKELTPRERHAGIDYKFPITNFYPKFWLKRASISSKSSTGGFSGDITGELLNITTEPKVLGKPAEAKLSGDFPNSKIYDVLMHAVIDHTTVIPKESGTIKVGAFPLYDMMLSKSSDITYGFKSAVGSSELTAELQEENLNLNFNATFAKIDYLVEAKSSKVKEILSSISENLGPLTLNGRAEGAWTKPKLGLNSNLGSRLQETLKQEFNKQVAELKQKIRAEVETRIAAEKAKLTDQLKEFENKLGISLKSKEDAINSLKAKLDDEKKKAGNKGSDKIKEEGKKLLKKLKF